VIFTIGVPNLLVPNGHLLLLGLLDGKQSQMFLIHISWNLSLFLNKQCKFN
jgi:hypothetical protein